MRFTSDGYEATRRLRANGDFRLFVAEIRARREQLAGQIELCNAAEEVRILQGRARELRELMQILEGTEQANHHATA